MKKEAVFGPIAGGSHQLVLLGAIQRTTKPILELGAGDSSTRQIDGWTKNKIVTIESSPGWMNKYIKMKSDRHSFLLMSEKEMIDFFEKDTTEWGVVFVDSGSWIGRIAAINKYKDTADYIVIHDTEYSARQGFFGKSLDDNKRDFSDTFKEWIEFMPPNLIELPATVVGSNKVSLKEFAVKRLILTNTNLK